MPNENTQSEFIGWSTPAQVIDVHDGDTVTVRVVREFNVRLEDCWAPEVGPRLGNKTVSAEERKRGQKAKEVLEGLLLETDGHVILKIPTKQPEGSLDANAAITFGRPVGRISIKGKDVSETLIELGFATKNKTQPTVLTKD